MAVFAATVMNTELESETGDASPTPASQSQARTEIRKRRLASQTQWDDQTTQMIGKIFRAIFRLEDKVERVASEVAMVKEHTEYLGSRVKYELHTEVPVANSGVDTPPPPPPLRGELDRLREEVQTIQRHWQQGEFLGELQVNLKKSQDLVVRIENKVEMAISTATQNAKEARPPGPEEKAQSNLKAKSRVSMAQAYPLPPSSPPSPPPPEGMDWEEVMAETERLGRSEQLAHLTADQPEATPTPTPKKKPTPKPAPKPAVPKPQPNPQAKAKPPAAPKPTQPAPQRSRPLGGTSYAAAARAAPTGGEEWTTVQRGDKPRGPCPQHQPQHQPQELRPVQGLNLDQRKFVFAREGPIPKRYAEADLISAVNRTLHQTGVPTHARIFQLRLNAKGTLAGLCTPFAPIEHLLEFRDTIIRAARTVDSGIHNFTANETWSRVKIHGVLLDRYLGRGTFGVTWATGMGQVQEGVLIFCLAVCSELA